MYTLSTLDLVLEVEEVEVLEVGLGGEVLLSVELRVNKFSEKNQSETFVRSPNVLYKTRFD